MAIDYSVTLDCKPKRHFGDGDHAQGMLNILERLKARNRFNAVRKLIQEQGRGRPEPTITVRTQDKQGNPVEKQISMAEMDAAASLLDAHAPDCSGCPANFLGEPYGCFAAINYPISQSGESWLLSRVQPPGTLGAQLCAEYIAEFQVTGDGIRLLRGRGFYQATKAGKVTLVKALLKGTSLSGDQLLETIFLAGNALDPGLCFGILIWLGAIRVDGVIPSSLEDKAVLRTLVSLRTREEKEKHTQLEIGARAPEPVAAFQFLVTALYLCWVQDVPLYISS